MTAERVKRNVEDVDYVQSDLTSTPMREVLARLRRLVHAQPKAIREAAIRKRAGMIGRMEACRCLWPLKKAETPSEHELWCPGHAMWLSSEAVAELRRTNPEYAL